MLETPPGIPAARERRREMRELAADNGAEARREWHVAE